MTATAVLGVRRTPARGRGFIRPQIASRLYRTDGTVETTRLPAVWTLAHRGYSGSGRLDVWVYPTQAAALYAGADLAMEAGLDEDPHARALFAAGKYAAVLRRYEQTHPDAHLLRVQVAFLQDDEDMPPPGSPENDRDEPEPKPGGGGRP